MTKIYENKLKIDFWALDLLHITILVFRIKLVTFKKEKMCIFVPLKKGKLKKKKFIL